MCLVPIFPCCTRDSQQVWEVNFAVGASSQIRFVFLKSAQYAFLEPPEYIRQKLPAQFPPSPQHRRLGLKPINKYASSVLKLSITLSCHKKKQSRDHIMSGSGRVWGQQEGGLKEGGSGSRGPRWGWGSYMTP